MASANSKRLSSLLFCCVLVSGAGAQSSLVEQVRGAAKTGEWQRAEKTIDAARTRQGLTPEVILAYSWLGRDCFSARRYREAEKFAAKTKDMAVAQLRQRKLDAEPNLPTALGAAIEVQANVMSQSGQRDAAVAYLREELARYKGSSIATRLQKNINLLDLVGKPAPPIVGLPAGALKGKAALVFFWAHWCGDCKSMADDLGKLRKEFEPKGLAIVMPTQRYGYAERGREVGAEEETSYIQRVREEFYLALKGAPAPIEEANFLNYGCSTTPTLLLIDQAGIVRLYSPGRLGYEDLSAKINGLLSAKPPSR